MVFYINTDPNSIVGIEIMKSPRPQLFPKIKTKGARQESTGADGEDQNMPRTRTS